MIAPNAPAPAAAPAPANPFRFRAEPNAETLTPEQLGPRHVGVREPFPTLESTYAHAVAEPDAEVLGTGATTADGWQLGPHPDSPTPAPITSPAPTTLRHSIERWSGWWSTRPRSEGRPPLVAAAIAYVKHNEFFVVTGLAGLILCYALVAGPLAPTPSRSLVVARPVPAPAVVSAPAARASGIVLGASSPSEATDAKPGDARIAGSGKAPAAVASTEPRERKTRTAPAPRARVKAPPAIAAATSRTAKSEAPAPAPKPADSETVESAKRELEAVSHELSATL